MLKNKIKIIALITLLIFSLFSPIVNAENETSTEATGTTEDPSTISESTEEIVIKEGDEYIFQDNVTLTNPVDGNLFIFANNVTINSQVGGDVFVFANSVTIGEDGYILSNLFACSNNVDVKGAAYNIYSTTNNLTIDGYVFRDIRTICNSLNINGMVGRNVFANCSNINFKESEESEENPNVTSYGNVQGNLTYYSNKELSFPEKAINGETNYTPLTSHLDISSYIYSLGAIIVSTIILWLISLWISPRLIHNTNKSISLKKTLQILGLGILVPVILTLLALIVLFIPIFTQFILLIISILAILFFASTSITIININDIICNKLKITKNITKIGFLILSTLVIWLLTLIPYLGVVIILLAMIWGIGNLSYKLFIKENSDKEKAEKKSSEKGKTEKEKDNKKSSEKEKTEEN